MKIFLKFLFFFLLLKQVCFAQWVHTSLNNCDVSCFAVSGTNLFAGTYWGDEVFLSTNNGTNWVRVNSGLPDTYVHCLLASGTSLFAGTNEGVFRSTNNGTGWTQLSQGLPNDAFRSLAVSSDGTTLFVGTAGHSVFRSTDNGTTWTTASSGMPTDNNINCLAVVGTNLFAGCGGIFRSTNYGESWTAVNLGIVDSMVHVVTSFAVDGNRIFVSVSAFGVILSTDNGESWSVSDSGLPTGFWDYAHNLAISGNNVFAAVSQSRGVFRSTDNGASWVTANDGLTDTAAMSLVVIGANLFVGTYGGGVWKRPLSEMITGVDRLSDLPIHFNLKQNYPNPFNPMTTIIYSISNKSNVVIKVYDLLGKEIQTLVNESKPAGNHQIEFNATNLPSGVYFYRFQAGSFNQVRKMLLLK